MSKTPIPSSTFGSSDMDVKLGTPSSSTSVLPPKAQHKRNLFIKVLKEEFLAELKYLLDVANDRAVARDTLTKKMVGQLKKVVSLIPGGGVIETLGDVAAFASMHHENKKISKTASLSYELDLPQLHILLDHVAREAFRRYEYFIVVLLSDEPTEGIIPFARTGAHRMLEMLSRNSEANGKGGFSIPLNEGILLQGLMEGRSGAWVDGFTNNSLKLKRLTKTLLGKIEPEEISAETVYARSGLRHYQADVSGKGDLCIVDALYIRQTAKHHERSFKGKIKETLSSKNAEAFYKYGFVEFEEVQNLLDIGGDPKAGYALAPLKVITDHYEFKEQTLQSPLQQRPSRKLQGQLNNFYPSVVVISSKIIRKYVSFYPPIPETGRAKISLIEYVRTKLKLKVDRLVCHEDLSDINLQGADLSHMDLSGAKFGVNLMGTIFDDCYLIGAHFEEKTNAKGASFQGAHCEFITAKCVNFTDANFTQADFSFGILNGSKLTGCKTLSAIWMDTEIWQITAPDEFIKECYQQTEALKRELVVQKEKMNEVEHKLDEHTSEILELQKKIKQLNSAASKTPEKFLETKNEIDRLSQRIDDLKEQQRKMINDQIQQQIQALLKNNLSAQEEKNLSSHQQTSKKPATISEYDLVLISVNAKQMVDLQRIIALLKENTGLTGKPILIKQGEKLSLYGLSEQGEWKLTTGLDAHPFKGLQFGKTLGVTHHDQQQLMRAKARKQYLLEQKQTKGVCYSRIEEELKTREKQIQNIEKKLTSHQKLEVNQLSGVKLDLKPVKTKKDGDALHAILGVWDSVEGQLICADIKEKRNKIYQAIVSENNKKEISELIMAGIKELVISNRGDTGTSTRTLIEQYQKFLNEQALSFSKSWSEFENLLRKSEHKEVMDYIQRVRQPALSSSSLHHQFYDALNKKEGELYGRILSLPMLHDAFQKCHSFNQEFDWNQHITWQVKKEYAEFISKKHTWLLPSELAIIAHLFEKTVIYYPSDTALPLTLNLGKSSVIEVRFDGVNHYERLELSHTDVITLSSRQVPQQVYQEIASKKAHVAPFEVKPGTVASKNVSPHPSESASTQRPRQDSVTTQPKEPTPPLPVSQPDIKKPVMPTSSLPQKRSSFTPMKITTVPSQTGIPKTGLGNPKLPGQSSQTAESSFSKWPPRPTVKTPVKGSTFLPPVSQPNVKKPIPFTPFSPLRKPSFIPGETTTPPLLTEPPPKYELRGYDLVLMSVSTEQKIDVEKIKEFLKENKECVGKPILINQGNEFILYGLSEQGEWKLTRGLDASQLKKLSFENKPALTDAQESESLSKLGESNNSYLPMRSELKIPGDNSCLFWSVAIGVLAPILDDAKQYRLVFDNLFVSDHKDEQLFEEYSDGLKNRIQAFLRNNDTTLISRQEGQDPFYHLINWYFRQKVASYIDSHSSDFSGFIEGSVSGYVGQLRQADFWGGDIEFRAIFKLLGENYHILVENSSINLGDLNKPTLHIIHTNAKGEIDGAKNHYNLRMPNVIGNSSNSEMNRPVIEQKIIPKNKLNKIVILQNHQVPKEVYQEITSKKGHSQLRKGVAKDDEQAAFLRQIPKNQSTPATGIPKPGLNNPKLPEHPPFRTSETSTTQWQLRKTSTSPQSGGLVFSSSQPDNKKPNPLFDQRKITIPPLFTEQQQTITSPEPTEINKKIIHNDAKRISGKADFQKGIQHYWKKEFSQAFSYFEKATQGNYPSAYLYLGYMQQFGEEVKQSEEAAGKYYEQVKKNEQWFKDQAETGVAEAQFSLGLYHQLVSGNHKQAVDSYQKAADQGHAHAQYALAECYELGRGIAKDNGQATLWYEKAVAQYEEKNISPTPMTALATTATGESKTPTSSPRPRSPSLSDNPQTFMPTPKPLMSGTSPARNTKNLPIAKELEILHGRGVSQLPPEPLSNNNNQSIPIPAPKHDPMPSVDQKALCQLLQYVVEGEQDKAKALIQQDKNLLLYTGNVTDLSDREFKQITAFQYALWAMDWHMWTMIQEYLPQNVQAEQYWDLETKGTAYGKHFSLKGLIDALQTFVDKAGTEWHYGGLRAKNHWCKVVGGEQKLLPAHIVNEYCRPDRAFEPCPSEWESKLPRTLKLYDRRFRLNSDSDGMVSVIFGNSTWFIPSSFFIRSPIDEGLGLSYAFIKYTGSHVSWESGESGLAVNGPIADLDALQSLWKTRTQQLEFLKSQLLYLLTQSQVSHFIPQTFIPPPKPKASPKQLELQNQLITACKQGDEKVVKALLQQEAKPDMANTKGEQPLGAAVWGMCPDVVNALLKQGGGVAPMTWQECEQHNKRYYNNEVFIVPKFAPQTFREWYQLYLKIDLNLFIRAFHLKKADEADISTRKGDWQYYEKMINEYKYTKNRKIQLNGTGGQYGIWVRWTEAGYEGFRSQIKQNIEFAIQPTVRGLYFY